MLQDQVFESIAKSLGYESVEDALAKNSHLFDTKKQKELEKLGVKNG